MSKTTKLVLFQLKYKYLSAIKGNLKGGKKNIAKFVGIMLLVIFGVGVSGAGYVWLLNKMFDFTIGIGMADAVLTIIIVSSTVVSLVFGIVYSLGMYYSKDTEFLNTLPVDRRSVFLSKFIPEVVSEILTFAVLVLPAMIVYGVKVSSDVFYWVKCVLILLSGPMIPFCIAALLSGALMRFSLFAQHRDKIITIGSILLFIAYFLGVQYLSQAMQYVDPQAVVEFLQSGLMQAIAKVFPPALWAAEALVYTGSSGLTPLLLFLAVGLVAFVLTVIFVGNMFTKGAIGQQETAKKRKRIDVRKTAVKSSRLMAIFKHEWKVILRSPVYAINSLMSVLFGPLMLIAIVFVPMGGGSSSEDLTLLFTELFAADSSIMIYVMMGLVGILLFTYSMNMGAFTAYSREGKAAWLPLSLPIAAKELFAGKLMFGQSINMLASSVTLISCVVLFKLPVLWALACLVSALILGTPLLIFGLYLDMSRPKLDWESENRAVKSNFNAVITMFLNFASIAVMVYLGVKITILTNIDIKVLAAAYVMFAAVVSVLGYLFVGKQSKKQLQKMGERI